MQKNLDDIFSNILTTGKKLSTIKSNAILRCAPVCGKQCTCELALKEKIIF
jgi:hypothetical protein